MGNASYQAGTPFEFDDLFATDNEIVTGKVTVLTGQELVRGAVVGLVTLTGKAKLLDKDASDGSEEVYGILVADVDASAADAEGLVYLKGDFKPDGLSFAAGTDADDIRADARTKGIFIR